VGEPFDLLIIGGGINGSALAEAAARNGYRVALVEQLDFGSGVTSRSTRLIHGGLRYLEHGHLGLVRESLRERETLLEEFPQQVRPLPFLIPVYRGDTRSPLWISLGLAAYDRISSSLLVDRHRRFSPDEVAALEPGLERQGLRAGFLYYDCQAMYPERLALEMALGAEEFGAVVANHSPVVGSLGEPGVVTGVRVEGGGEYRSRLVINAAGPWVDRVRRLLGSPGERPFLSLINGTHIVTRSFAGAPSHAIYREAGSDHRPFFVIPWRGLWLIGTTETPHQGDPGVAPPTRREVDYLLTETNRLFPAANLGPHSVVYSYAGPRPLLHASTGAAQSMSREHAIYDHEAEEGIRGMITLAGGKLTTARAFAGQALERIAAKLGKPRPRRIARPRSSPDGLPPRLTAIYGARAAAIVRLTQDRPDLDRPVCPSCPTIAAELVYAVRREKARTLGDLLLRRTGLGFEPCLGLDCAPEAARIAAPWLGWDQAAVEDAVTDYRRELQETLYRGASG